MPGFQKAREESSYKLTILWVEPLGKRARLYIVLFSIASCLLVAIHHLTCADMLTQSSSPPMRFVIRTIPWLSLISGFAFGFAIRWFGRVSTEKLDLRDKMMTFHHLRRTPASLVVAYKVLLCLCGTIRFVYRQPYPIADALVGAMAIHLSSIVIGEVAALVCIYNRVRSSISLTQDVVLEVAKLEYERYKRGVLSGSFLSYLSYALHNFYPTSWTIQKWSRISNKSLNEFADEYTK